MLEKPLLDSFKALSREDHLIADELARRIDLSGAQSILEVGAASAVIGTELRALAAPGCKITLVEPNPDYRAQYPRDAQIVNSTWEECDVEGVFDLIILSHVMGHFPIELRESLALRTDLLTPAGHIALVTNAPREPFWSLNTYLARSQGHQYVIDFPRLERALGNRGLSWCVHEFSTALQLGSSENEAVNHMNVFFPRRFNDAEMACVRSFLNEEAREGHSREYTLPLIQRMYVIAASAR